MFADIYTIVGLILIAIILICSLIARHHEKNSYNNGICPLCGNKLRRFDTDSQGGRGYTCDNCGYSTWISYNVDKK